MVDSNSKLRSYVDRNSGDQAIIVIGIDIGKSIVFIKVTTAIWNCRRRRPWKCRTSPKGHTPVVEGPYGRGPPRWRTHMFRVRPNNYRHQANGKIKGNKNLGKQIEFGDN